VGEIRKEDHLRNLGEDGNVSAKMYLTGMSWKAVNFFIWLRMQTSMDSCKHRSEPSGYTKYGEFRDLLKNR
jgi:hypothetical protein